MTLTETTSTHFIGPLPPLPSLAGYSNPGAPYRVHWGYYGDHREEFMHFCEALRFYAKKNGDQWGAQLLGNGVDGDCDGEGFHMCSDGLTELERECVEAVEAGEEVPNV